MKSTRKSWMQNIPKQKISFAYPTNAPSFSQAGEESMDRDCEQLDDRRPEGYLQVPRLNFLASVLLNTNSVHRMFKIDNRYRFAFHSSFHVFLYHKTLPDCDSLLVLAQHGCRDLGTSIFRLVSDDPRFVPGNASLGGGQASDRWRGRL